MKVVIEKNSTAFMTRDLKRVITRAFDRVGVTGIVKIGFVGQKRGRGGVNYDRERVIDWPDGSGLTFRQQGQRATFWVGPKMDAIELCSAARWVGYGMRGVIGRERWRMYPASPADKEFLADKPLIPKKTRAAKPARPYAEVMREQLERKLVRCRASIAKTAAKKRRLETKLKKLARREKAIERWLAKTAGAEG